MDFENTTSTSPIQPSHAGIAAAVERRIQQEREAAEAAVAASGHPLGAHAAFDANHERRQAFRRLIDPGIMRPNAREVALDSLQILKKLAENIIEHPEEAKYQRFKPTNAKIKRLLVDPKGTLEYAVEMGFRPEVENFQPFYIFNKHHVTDLKIGLAMINEALELQVSKQERDERAKREAKEAAETEKEKLKRQFLDDRKSMALRQQREREAREAAAARSASPSALSSPVSPSRRTSHMQGAGRTLSGQVVTNVGMDAPPPYGYEDISDEED